ncbi:MAG: hypothetical protein K0S01_203 [Herbinix sp.]|jgi:hypothetical protein|nr:hypothetical protein [Herbinix sp.]
MNENLSNHLELLFENAPKTRRAFELKEELLANSVERYDDLIKNGVTPENAYKNVINSIGNVSELFKGLEEMSQNDIKQADEKVKKLALIKTIAVGLYIFSVFILILFALLADSIHTPIDLPLLGFLLMILIDIVPTCMLVYVSSVYPHYRKQDDTVVESFKEWKSESYKSKSIKGSVITVMWTIAVLLYFAISFATFAWYATWIIFLVAICAQAIISLIFRLKEMK